MLDKETFHGWEYDPQQKRHFRRNGNIIEYAPTITVGGIEIENIGDNLAKLHKAMREAAAAREAAEMKAQQEKHTAYSCPFIQAPTLRKECRTDCALYRAAGCVFKHQEAAQDTEGKPCPFLYRCSPQCALYDHGCTL